MSTALSSRLKKILIDKYVCVGKRDTTADKKTKEVIRNLQEKDRKKPGTAKASSKSYFSQEF